MFFLQESNLKFRNLIWHYAKVTKIFGLRLTLEYVLNGSRKTIERSKRQVVRIASEEELGLTPQDKFDRIVGISGLSKSV